jgi:hypothetical protein
MEEHQIKAMRLERFVDATKTAIVCVAAFALVTIGLLWVAEYVFPVRGVMHGSVPEVEIDTIPEGLGDVSMFLGRSNETNVTRLAFRALGENASLVLYSSTLYFSIGEGTKLVVTSDLVRVVGAFANVNPSPPQNATSPCEVGTQAFDLNYEYRCIAKDRWKKIPYV